MRKAAAEAGKLIKADGRREGVESVEAMRKRGLKVHAVTPDVEAQWKQIAESTYPKIRGRYCSSGYFRRGDESIKNISRGACRGQKVSSDPSLQSPLRNPSRRRNAGLALGLRNGENLLIAIALAILMLLPLAEIILRKAFHGGLTGSTAFQQHLVLIIGLLGGMFAARTDDCSLSRL